MNNKELLEALKEAHSKVKGTESSNVTQVTPQAVAIEKPIPETRVMPRSVEDGISDDTVRKLEKMGGSHWTPKEILESLADEQFEVFPAIQMGDDVLCPEMVYRRLRRKGSTLCIDSGNARYSVISKKRGERYRAWMSYYQKKGVADATDQSASMCIYELEVYLKSFDDHIDSGWIKVINLEQYELVK